MTDFAALIDGYRRFQSDGWTRQRARWESLKDAQSPKVMLIGCSDSRVDPAIIFDLDPGAAFIVRNVANLVPPFETGGGRHGVSAALEFAVTQLQVEEIIVLGHGRCGGCEAALTQRYNDRAPGEGGFIDHWIDQLNDARDRVIAVFGDGTGPAALRAMEHASVEVSLANLRTFPFVQSREAAGTLRLHGAWFAISDGVLHLLDETSGRFEPA